MINPSIEQMLEVGRDCGLHTVGQAYGNYLNHYQMFFSLENLEGQTRAFELQLQQAGLGDEQSIADALLKINQNNA